MAKVARCQRCKGTKIVMILGGMEDKCKECSGTGRAIKIEDLDEDQFLQSIPEVNSKKVDKRSKEYRDSMSRG